MSGPAAAPSPETAVAEVWALVDAGKAAEAAKTASAAVARFKGNDSDAAWELRVLHGRTLISAGQAHDARELLERLRLPPRLAKSKTAVQRLLMLASACYRLNARDAALQYAGAAERIARGHDPASLPQIVFTQATIAGGKEGERLARKAIRLAATAKDRELEIKVSGTLALMLAKQERFAEALEIWQPLLENAPSESLRERLEGNVGWAYASLGDHETGEVYFQRAAARAKQSGSAFELTWVEQLGNMQRWKRDRRAAARYYREALRIGRAKKQKRDLPSTLANYATLLLETACYDQARRAVSDARGIIAGEESEYAIALDVVEARIDAATHRLAEAEKLLRNVLGRATKASQKWDAHGRLAELHAQRKDISRATVEFDAALAQARTARAEIDDFEKRLPFNNNVADLYDTYVEFLVAANRPEDALRVTELARAATLEEGRRIRTVADPKKIARQHDAILLCYWLGRTRSHLWIVTPTMIERKDLPPDAQLDALAAGYQGELLHRNAKLDSERGKKLYGLLVAPAAHVLKPDARVIVVADGNLHALNMETLVVPVPQPHYWIHDAIVTHASSLQLLGGDVVETARPKNVLVIGNPPQVTPEFPRLRDAEREIGNVRRHFDRVTVIEKEAAVPEAYAKASPATYDVIHFVSHAVASKNVPLDSAIILGRRGAGDFKLYAREIHQQKLRASLVTISSCHGAGNRQYAGEGLVGLSWAFLSAGAKQVIAALWAVDDEATPLLMEKLYAGIAAGKEPAAALREAKLATMSQGYGKPKFWAPFVLYSGS
ncbi:MAG TPA: CHAT domain-containing protein [Thermoanaerobaculia bacterium]